ncbi:hypothetical protein [Luteimonas terricola]|uniref:Uncharacterized protein n=1 Tax=Luteimonas terricola TaxID=645597 RepID=A0ABQ2E526_9GAMM|nr:hypothetical protein [Luteimonas terricola]GGJ95658.1 hypothetical protein GCM10011394_00480 [Luteimonas terricola]
MTRNPIPAALAAALLATLALAGCKKDEPAPPPPVATPAPAPTPAPTPAPAPMVSVTSVDLGNAIDGNNRVAAPATTFATTDTIHASVATVSSDPSTPQAGELTARWTYEGDQLVDETSRDFSFTGTGTTAFEISKPDGWPTGNYRVEILHDGQVVQTRDFEVR